MKDNDPDGSKGKNLGKYETGVWTDWVFHVKWSWESNGLLKVWKNGEKVIHYKGPIGYNDKRGVYFKTGIYKWVWKMKSQRDHSTTTKRVIYVDEVRIGNQNATYQDVVSEEGKVMKKEIDDKHSRSHIIEAVTESIKEAKDREFAGSKGGTKYNKLTDVSAHTRAGNRAFKHWVHRLGERSELAMTRTEIGGTYWYGWSLFLPDDFDHRGSDTIVMQLATWPTPRNGKFPCSANGPYMEIKPDGRLIMYLQHNGDDRDMVCDKFTLIEDISLLKGRWVDFVMNAKWTGDRDGFFKFWMRSGDDDFQQKIDYKGRTWWNDEDDGPYFKMGAYMGEPGWNGPETRTLYTDEYRLGSKDATFEDVAPGNDIEKGDTK